MISEVVNALFITYVGTEYLLETDNSSTNKRLTQLLQSQAFRVVLGIVILLNVIDRVTGAAEVINDLLQGFLHLPKVVFAAMVFEAFVAHYNAPRFLAELTNPTLPRLLELDRWARIELRKRFNCPSTTSSP